MTTREPTGASPEIDFGPFEAKEIKVSDLDRSLQVRVGISTNAVKDYSERMAAGDAFPNPTVFDDGAGHLILADGHHTATAHETRHGAEAKVMCNVYKGTMREALLYAAQANRKHGVPLTPKDKRRIVEMFVTSTELKGWASRRIAAHCRVSHTLVDDVRSAMRTSVEPAEAKQGSPPVREGLDGRKYRVRERKNGGGSSTGSGCQSPDKQTNTNVAETEHAPENKHDLALGALPGADPGASTERRSRAGVHRTRRSEPGVAIEGLLRSGRADVRRLRKACPNLPIRTLLRVLSRLDGRLLHGGSVRIAIRAAAETLARAAERPRRKIRKRAPTRKSTEELLAELGISPSPRPRRPGARKTRTRFTP
jgi:hypothetical protein